MVIIDFSSTSKKAFLHGFSKGLSAPVMLFGKFNAPPLRKYDLVVSPAKDDGLMLENAWSKIGQDFKNVMTKYGEETNNQK